MLPFNATFNATYNATYNATFNATYNNLIVVITFYKLWSKFQKNNLN